AGQRAAELDTLSQNGLDGKELAHRLAGLIMKQVFEHGFFHADLHPGNIYFLPENIICFLDFGMMGRVDRKSREDFSRLV
ncbi:MAG: phosphotransferase, partial [Nitrospinaceae bacterium]|nr:phosphotransferase [Nitrospinaceae bacterium]NIR56008.1 phosphotransferase [Nitrospinaceae bacterium]NIS86452.1 phosphotransferase [Nitrospinaceae bacterium]NIT85072.1 phosphotransferase [Nitrospinaceae bacterium]NIU45497.1 phosphotransferase [Nitrospinaceae bacterium]